MFKFPSEKPKQVTHDEIRRALIQTVYHLRCQELVVSSLQSPLVESEDPEDREQ